MEPSPVYCAFLCSFIDIFSFILLFMVSPFANEHQVNFSNERKQLLYKFVGLNGCRDRSVIAEFELLVFYIKYEIYQISFK